MPESVRTVEQYDGVSIDRWEMSKEHPQLTNLELKADYQAFFWVLIDLLIELLGWDFFSSVKAGATHVREMQYSHLLEVGFFYKLDSIYYKKWKW